MLVGVEYHLEKEEKNMCGGVRISEEGSGGREEGLSDLANLVFFKR